MKKRIAAMVLGAVMAIGPELAAQEKTQAPAADKAPDPQAIPPIVDFTPLKVLYVPGCTANGDLVLAKIGIGAAPDEAEKLKSGNYNHPAADTPILTLQDAFALIADPITDASFAAHDPAITKSLADHFKEFSDGVTKTTGIKIRIDLLNMLFRKDGCALGQKKLSRVSFSQN